MTIFYWQDKRFLDWAPLLLLLRTSSVTYYPNIWVAAGKDVSNKKRICQSQRHVIASISKSFQDIWLDY